MTVFNTWIRSAISTSLVVCLFAVSGCRSDSTVSILESEDLTTYFSDAGVVGVFVLYDENGEHSITNNLERANDQFLPASTFKIFNSLVALQTGVVSDTSTSFKWDGVTRSIPQWNRDHTLTSAYANSAVWVYQDIARRIGPERMEQYVRSVAYGNQQISGGIDQFWLSGDLRISALEQIDFLRRFRNRQLSFSESVVGKVEGIMIEEEDQGATLYAKSGWASGDPADIGWYVGFVSRDDNVYCFAVNIDIYEDEQGDHRRGIARSILADLGILNR